jgi:hypothetical protein
LDSRPSTIHSAAANPFLISNMEAAFPAMDSQRWAALTVMDHSHSNNNRRRIGHRSMAAPRVGWASTRRHLSVSAIFVLFQQTDLRRMKDYLTTFFKRKRFFTVPFRFQLAPMAATRLHPRCSRAWNTNNRGHHRIGHRLPISNSSHSPHNGRLLTRNPQMGLLMANSSRQMPVDWAAMLTPR